ncbi:hypothetical protein F3Y22_tig00005406pilonHSYRG00292 [Hibiscus syriacus]|uniref:Uncharacterized protein n=1 Tax=Hibiscus syriacus TaxID=106335 RepID=A0A6A3CEE8_HIBSY|nr:hypothetical protein F3Y22_tig00005406pilonHSYRG00292 [Hibiscus syriacus]
MLDGQEGSSRKEVLVHVDEEEVRKLMRCLVGKMAGVCSVGSIVDRLHNWGLGEIRVQRLRGNFFLLTIKDEDLFFMLEDLQWSYLKEIFVDVKMWTESLCHKERVVWLEIDGLLLQCWNEITLKRLVGLWGTFEAYGDNVKHHLDCEKVNMMISTTMEARIDEVVDVEGVQGVGDLGVESKALGADEVIIINDGVSMLNDRDRDVGAVVGVTEIGLPNNCNKAIEESSGMGLADEGFMDFNCDKVLSKRERKRRDRVLKRLNLKKYDLIFSELSGRSLPDSDLKRRKADAYVEAEKTLVLGVKL